jgi:CheY-like chemotaxis protein
MPVKMADFLEVVLAMCQPLIGQKNLKLVNQISPDFPAVLADSNRLQQILYNLIGNAIKFTEAGFVKISAKLIPQDRPDQPPQMAITISDTGIGISEDKLDRIFESFEQADGSTARVYGGTGLGLAITKQLVELHGGTITVASTPGAGSHFTFTLPVVADSTQQEPQIPLFKEGSFVDRTPQAPEILTPPVNDAGINLESESSPQFKILIVDDEPINLQVLANYLSLANYQIAKASNGLEALNIIEQGFQPDLILLDVMMPHMTGYEVTQKLRETWPMSELPIMMITAKNTVSDLVFGFEVGANDYLGKPFIKEELMARIRTHLKIKQKG